MEFWTPLKTLLNVVEEKHGVKGREIWVKNSGSATY